MFTGLLVLRIYSQTYSFGSTNVPAGITQDPSYPPGPLGKVTCLDGRFAVIVAAEFVAGDIVPGRKTKPKLAFEAGTAVCYML